MKKPYFTIFLIALLALKKFPYSAYLVFLRCMKVYYDQTYKSNYSFEDMRYYFLAAASV